MTINHFKIVLDFNLIFPFARIMDGIKFDILFYASVTGKKKRPISNVYELITPM